MLFIPKLLPRRLDGTGPKAVVFTSSKLAISQIKRTYTISYFSCDSALSIGAVYISRMSLLRIYPLIPFLMTSAHFTSGYLLISFSNSSSTVTSNLRTKTLHLQLIMCNITKLVLRSGDQFWLSQTTLTWLLIVFRRLQD
jgi:hypothetical protein